MKAHVDCLHQLEQLQAAHERLLNEQRIAHAHAATQADQLLAAQRELAQERASHMELVRQRLSSLDEAPTCNLNQCQHNVLTAGPGAPLSTRSGRGAAEGQL